MWLETFLDSKEKASWEWLEEMRGRVKMKSKEINKPPETSA